MFEGFVALATTTFNVFLQVKNSSGTPSTPDAAPSYRIYGPAGGTALLTGTFSASDTDSQTGWRASGNIAITTANGFAAGSTYRVRKAWAVSSTNYVEDSSFTVV